MAVLRCAVLLLVSGCAHAVFHPEVTPDGRLRRDAALGRAAEALDAEALSAVHVSEGELPPGVVVAHGEVVVTNPRFTYVGEVETELDRSEAIVAPAWFYPYETRWRRPWCGAQVPLVWASFGVWTASPTAWPCFVVETNADAARERREDHILEALVRGAAAAGGNVLVVTAIGDVRFVDGWTGAEVGRQDSVSGRGLVLKETPPAP